MVKSTVRFPGSVVDEIEELVEEGYFESKSEFHRFASEYVLEQIAEDYTPQMLDFEDVKSDLLLDKQVSEMTNEHGDRLSFLQSATVVRRYAFRGKVRDAEDFIDHHYSADDRECLLLEELLRFYRQFPHNQPARTQPTADQDQPSEWPSWKGEQ